MYTNDEEPLIAVSYESMKPAGAIGPTGHLLQTAMIRGESSERDATFKIQTCMLTSEQEQYCRELKGHGFVVVELPSEWRYKYSTDQWQGKVIKSAWEAVHQVSRQPDEGNSASYDVRLATFVLETLNEAFPNALTLMRIRYRMGNAPSDRRLAPALAALSGDGYIDQHFVTTSRLYPMYAIAITKEGRRHLEEMSRKNTRSSKNGYTVNDASQFILAQLLDEFRNRKLTTKDLQQTYQGLPPAELKNRALSHGINDVDFDLAMSELDSHELVKTGPTQLCDNPPFSSVTVIAFYSKNEYSYLTEEGYKEATRARRGTPAVAHGGPVIHGDQYINYGQAAAIGRHSIGTINHQQQWADIQNQIDFNTLASELEQLKKHLLQGASSSSDFQRLGQLADAEQYAKKKDGSKVIEVLSKVGKGTLSVAKDIGTTIAAKVIAKSMGLEP